MKVKRVSPVGLVLFLLMLAGCGGGTSGSGGTSTVDVRGLVVNAQREGIPAAAVTLSDTNGQAVATTETDQLGSFVFSAVPQRSGEIKVELPQNGGTTQVSYAAPPTAAEVKIAVRRQNDGRFKNEVTFRRRDDSNNDDDEDSDDDTDDDSDPDDGDDQDDPPDSDDGDDGQDDPPGDGDDQPEDDPPPDDGNGDDSDPDNSPPDV